MAIQFGVVTSTGYGGIIQNRQEVDSGDVRLAVDAAGYATDYQTSNRVLSASMDYIFDDSLTKPVFADLITIGSDEYLITSVTKGETNKGFVTLKIEAKRWPKRDTPLNI